MYECRTYFFFCIFFIAHPISLLYFWLCTPNLATAENSHEPWWNQPNRADQRICWTIHLAESNEPPQDGLRSSTNEEYPLRTDYFKPWWGDFWWLRAAAASFRSWSVNRLPRSNPHECTRPFSERELLNFQRLWQMKITIRLWTLLFCIFWQKQINENVKNIGMFSLIFNKISWKVRNC